ncbi:MAG TPA: hypothetical protein VG057_01915 [Solirubrobacteraceae bacterium]|nr:hypothetical protein [Solirubrobacteraceae bacterium]
MNTRLSHSPDQHHGLSPAFADLALAGSAVRMARIALAGTRATGEHIGIFDEHPVIMAAASDPDVMRHIRHTVRNPRDIADVCLALAAERVSSVATN